MDQAILVGTQKQLEELRDSLPNRDAVEDELVQHFHSLLDRLTPFSSVFNGLRIGKDELSSSRSDVRSMSYPDSATRENSPEVEQAKRRDRTLLRDRIDAALLHVQAIASQQTNAVTGLFPFFG